MKLAGEGVRNDIGLSDSGSAITQGGKIGDLVFAPLGQLEFPLFLHAMLDAYKTAYPYECRLILCSLQFCLWLFMFGENDCGIEGCYMIIN